MQWLVFQLEPGLEMRSVQGQRLKLAESQASRVCLAGQSSTVQAGWAVLAVLAMQGTQLQTVAGSAKGC